MIKNEIDIIERISEDLRVNSDFEMDNEEEIVSLIEVNERMKNIKKLENNEEIVMNRKRLKKIKKMEYEMEEKSDIMRNDDEIGIEVMKISRNEKLKDVKEMIDEYQLLWKDIMAQITVLKTECEDEIQKKELEERKVDEVDESVKVEKMRFEKE
jgi:hypothetical protein